MQYNDSNQEFTVTGIVGSFDLNALWFSNGDATDGQTISFESNATGHYDVYAIPNPDLLHA